LGKLKQFAYNVGLSLDQLVNVLLLGDPDSSLSSRLGRAYASGRPKWFVTPLMRANDAAWKFLTGEENHSVNAIEPEETGDKELWSWIKND
jgi:hypothetical protein